jgi:hypothetical protein
MRWELKRFADENGKTGKALIVGDATRQTNPMSNLDNQPDPSWTEVQKGNAQAEVMRKLIQSKFPRTYRLLNGIRFQLPVRRQADYPNHEYAADWDGQLLMDGLTASRLNLLGDPTRWKPIAGAFLVVNEWLKQS